MLDFAPTFGTECMETITEEVREVIAKQLKIPVERVKPDASIQDLGVESLDLIEIIFALEEKFDVSIPYNPGESDAAGKGVGQKVGLGDLSTIAQISEALRALLAAKASA
jgi:acyl carrier protein